MTRRQRVGVALLVAACALAATRERVDGWTFVAFALGVAGIALAS